MNIYINLNCKVKGTDICSWSFIRYLIPPLKWYFLLLGLMALLSGLTVFLFKFKRKKVASYVVGFLSVFLAIFFGSVFLEIFFWWQHKAPYYQKSNLKVAALSDQERMKQIKYDLELKDYPQKEDTLILARDLMAEAVVRPSRNADYGVAENGWSLASKNGQPAYLELVINKPLDYPNDFYQVIFSLLVNSEKKGQAYTSTFEYPDRNGEKFAHDDYHLSSEWHVLANTFFSQDSPNGANFVAADAVFRMRIYTKGGRISFSSPSLRAIRVDFPYDPMDPNFNDQFQYSANIAFHKPVNKKKDESRYRILCLGGSTTYGYGTGGGNNYPFILQSLLNAFAEPKAKKDFEVINAGLMGNTSFGILYQLDRTDMFPKFKDRNLFAYTKFPLAITKYTLLDLEPDLAIIAPMFNDLYYATIYNFPPVKQTLADQIKFFLRGLVYDLDQGLKRSFVARYNAIGYYIYTNYNNFWSKRVQNFTGPSFDNAVEHYEKVLTVVIEKLKEKGVEVVLLQFPYKSETEQEGRYREIYQADKEVLGRLAEKYQLPYLNLTEDNDNRVKDQHYWYDYVHPSAVGYGDYALKIFNFLFPEIKPGERLVLE